MHHSYQQQFATFARKTFLMKRFLIPAAAVMFFSCNTKDGDPIVEPPPVQTSNGIAAPASISVALISEYPHDTAAFTEGLFIHDGKLYEGTGGEGTSYIQVSDIKTGRVEKKYPITDPKIFGEGINIIKDKLYQLTYQNHIVYVYDVKDLSKPIKTFQWPSEGWGMTNNGTELIISTGEPSGNIYFVNPENFRTNRIIPVTDNNGPVMFVNELEYIDGFIYANVWGTTQLIKIDPANGHVVGRIETKQTLSSFYASYPIQQMDNVLNGIAYDSTTKKMYITGKNWPKLFEIRFN